MIRLPRKLEVIVLIAVQNRLRRRFLDRLGLPGRWRLKLNLIIVAVVKIRLFLGVNLRLRRFRFDFCLSRFRWRSIRLLQLVVGVLEHYRFLSGFLRNRLSLWWLINFLLNDWLLLNWFRLAHHNTGLPRLHILLLLSVGIVILCLLLLRLLVL